MLQGRAQKLSSTCNVAVGAGGVLVSRSQRSARDTNPCRKQVFKLAQTRLPIFVFLPRHCLIQDGSNLYSSTPAQRHFKLEGNLPTSVPGAALNDYTHSFTLNYIFTQSLQAWCRARICEQRLLCT